MYVIVQVKNALVCATEAHWQHVVGLMLSVSQRHKRITVLLLSSLYSQGKSMVSNLLGWVKPKNHTSWADIQYYNQ